MSENITDKDRIAELEQRLHEMQMLVMGYQQQCADQTMQLVQLRIALAEATAE